MFENEIDKGYVGEEFSDARARFKARRAFTGRGYNDFDGENINMNF